MTIHLDMPDTEYHARTELSSTEARMMLDSPAKYRWRKDNPPLIDESDRFDVGKAVHTQVLGTGAEIAVLDFPDYRTIAARSARDEARADGLAPVLKAQYTEIQAMASAILTHPTAGALLTQEGDPEVSLFTTDPDTGVECRARFDWLPSQGTRRIVAVDVKTTADASVNGFERSVANYQYDVQQAWYLDALGWEMGPMPAGFEPAFVFVCVEKTPPYLVAVHQLSIQWAEMGRTKAAKARALFKACTESGEWPGYPSVVQLLSPPTYAVYDFEARYAS